MTLERKVKNVRVSLADINEEVKHITTAWNRENENKIQHPIYPASIGGTIYHRYRGDRQPDEDDQRGARGISVLDSGSE